MTNVDDKEIFLPGDAASEHSPDPYECEKPEGGWGWIVCCGTFLVNFIVFGIHNSFGVVYEYLVNERSLGEAETAWVGAMAVSLNFLCGPLSSILCDRFGCRRVAFFGAILSVTGLFITSFITRLHYMYITYGLLWGMGSSFSFVPSIVMLGNYFDKRLALANGLGTSGSGVGSLVASPVINYTLRAFGWKTSFRIISGAAAFLAFACIVYRPLRTKKEYGRSGVKRPRSKLCDISIWKNRAYVTWVVTIALFQFGYPVPFVHMVKYANDLGVPTSKGAWLVGFLSIMSTLGRVVFGKICEHQRVNKLHVYQLSLFVIGMSTVICPFTESYAGFVVYSLVFGFFDGCFVGQVAVITGEIAGKGKLSQAVGNMFGVVAVPMILGAPVAGWLHEAFGSYRQAFFVCGSFAIASSLLLFVVSFMVNKQRRRVILSTSSRKAKEPYEESLVTGSESCALSGFSSHQTLVIASRETVL